MLTMLLCSYCCFTVSRSDCDFFFLISVYCTVPHEGQTLTETGLRNLSSNTWTPLTNTTRLNLPRLYSATSSAMRGVASKWYEQLKPEYTQTSRRTDIHIQAGWNAKKTYDLSLSWTVLHKITHTLSFIWTRSSYNIKENKHTHTQLCYTHIHSLSLLLLLIY